MVIDTDEKVSLEKIKGYNQEWHYVIALTEEEARALKGDILSFAHRVLTDPANATEGERAVLPRLIEIATACKGY
jgi:hypothetical protein